MFTISDTKQAGNPSAFPKVAFGHGMATVVKNTIKLSYCQNFFFTIFKYNVDVKPWRN